MKNRISLFLAGAVAVLCLGAASIPYVLIKESRNVSLYGSSNYVANLYGSGANLTGIPSANGTSNYLAKFSGSNVLTNSVIYEVGGNVGIGTTGAVGKLDVQVASDRVLRMRVNGQTPEFYAANDANNAYLDLLLNGYTTFQSTGNVGIGTNNPTAAKLVVVGGGYFYGDVSCSNIVDLSDSPATLSDAVAIVTSIETTNGKVDHAKLSPLAWGTKEVGNGIFTTNKTTTVTAAKTNIVEQVIPASGGYQAVTNYVKEVIPAKTNVVNQVVEGKVAVPDQSKRNLSMVVSAQSLTIKDLLTRIEKLETTIKDFETRIGKLEAPK